VVGGGDGEGSEGGEVVRFFECDLVRWLVGRSVGCRRRWKGMRGRGSGEFYLDIFGFGGWVDGWVGFVWLVQCVLSDGLMLTRIG